MLLRLLLDLSLSHSLRVRMLRLIHILRVRMLSLSHSLPVMSILPVMLSLMPRVSLLLLRKRWSWKKL
jgi:hypothetical protein